jgi:hypothetical protein
MVKSWINQGIGLWAVQTASLFLVKDQGSYTMSSTGDHITDSWSSTQLSTAAVSTDTTIEVDSITGISDGDYIGIILDDNTAHWTTVNGAPSGTTVTLTDAITGAAAIDNNVYFYTTKSGAAEAIIDAVHRIASSNSDRPMNIIARADYYNNYGNKTSNGSPTEIYVDDQLDSTVLRIYPEPDTSLNRIEFTYQRTLEDFDAATDTPDFPQAWYEALCWNLAKRLMVKYGTPREMRMEIRQAAMETLSDAMSFDSENASLYLEVNMQGK